MGRTTFFLLEQEQKAKKKAAEEKEKQEIKNITDLNADPAIKLVNETEDIEQLETWLEEEMESKERKTVIEALENQLEELSNDGDEE